MRRGKYNAVRSAFAGRLYDSGAERDYAILLAGLVASGEVKDVVEQPRVEIEKGVHYKPDFVIQEKGRSVDGLQLWRTVAIDVKGVETERFRLIKKLWRLHMDYPLRVVKRAGRGLAFKTTQEVLPKGI